MVYLPAAYLQHCYKCNHTNAIKIHVRNFPCLPLYGLLRSFNYMMTLKDILFKMEGLFFHRLAEKNYSTGFQYRF